MFNHHTSFYERFGNLLNFGLLLFIDFIALIIGSFILYRACVFYIFLYCVYLGLQEKKWVNPYLLFSLTPLTLLIYFNISEYYMLSLSHNTWVLAIINFTAFIFALKFTPAFHRIKNCVSIKGNKNLVIHGLFFMLLSLLADVIPALTAVIWSFSVVAIVCFLKTGGYKYVIFALLLMLIQLKSGESSKMGILLSLLTIVICYEKYFSRNKIRIRTLLILGLFGVFVMFFAFRFATKGNGEYNNDDMLNYYSRNGIEWNYSSALFLPYMYLETPWTNVEYVIQTQDSRTYGLWMVKPILGYFGLDESFENQYKLEHYSSFNTFTFLVVPFKDFGLWLSIISTLFLGLFVKKVYSRYLISRSPLDTSSYILVAIAVFEMFFSNHFYQQSYPFTLFILMELYKPLLILTGNKKELENCITVDK